MITSASNDQNGKDWKDAKQYRQANELDKYLFSDEFFSLFKKLLKYDLDTLLSLSSAEAKELCAKQVRRLQSIRQKAKMPAQFMVDNQLAAIIMQNQMRALLDLQRMNEENIKKFNSPSKKRVTYEIEESRDNLVVRRYEGVYSEIQRNQEEIRYFMQAEVVNKNQVDFALCQKFFKKQASKLKRISNQKMIISRADLLQAISYFLGEAHRALHPQHKQKVHEDGEESDQQDINREDSPSYEQVNKWRRLASRFIQQKLVQLSGVCQQIPQLQAFNRTLQFSQLQSRQKIIFLKIVDVLISLHHRVSYLSRNKPQLMRELEHAQQELLCLHNGCELFLTRLEDEQTQIVSITFASEVKKHNQLSDYFLQVRKHIIRLCEIIMNQDQYHSQLLTRADKLVHIIMIFSKAFMGNHECLEEWEELINSGSSQNEMGGLSQDEYNLLLQLQQCFLEHHNKLILMQNGEQQSTTRTNEQLEDEVNKLISDYQRLKEENRQLVQSLEMLSKVKEDLQIEVEERDNMIYNLSGLKLTLEKKLANQEGVSSHSQHNLGEQLKKQQHQTQKYLESSLLLREQLKVSENQRERLIQLMDFQKQKHTKQLQLLSRYKIQKQSLQVQKQQLNEKVEKMRNDHQRQMNKLNKQINDLTNDKELLEMEMQRAVSNNEKLMERLDISEKKLKEHIKNNQNDDNESRRSEREYKYELQSEKYHNQAERYRKEAERARRDLESKKMENEVFERENNDFRLEIVALKAKIKEIRNSEDDLAEKEELFRETKSKLQKANLKIAGLSKQNSELRQEEEQLSNKLKYSTKRVKELEARLSQIELQNGRMNLEIQQKNNQNIDLQKSLTSQSNQFNTQIRYLKDLNDKQGQQLKQRQSKQQNLQYKITRLQQQLSRKGAQNEQKTKEIADLKIKRFQTVIEEQRINRVKLEESNRQLSTKLNEKIEVEIKLNFEIGRLSKEIDRLKQMLEKYIRELTEKELIIKFQKEQNEKQVRILEEIKMKERIRQENQGTPSRPISSDPNKRSGGDFDTPSQFDNLSKSNVKYDIYFNAKEYERLQSEYHEYRQSSSQRIEQLERIVEEIRKNKVELQVKYTNLQIQNKKIINSRAFNNSSPQGDDRRKVQALQAKLKEAYSNIDNLSKRQAEILSNQSLRQQFERTRISLQQKESIIRRHQTKMIELVSEIEKTKNIGQQRESFFREKQSLQSQLQQLRNRLAANSAQTANNTQTANSDLQRKIQALQQDIMKRESQKNKLEQSKRQLLNERDLIRKQYDDLRKHLQEETKRKVHLEGELLQAREEIKRIQVGSNEQIALKKQIEVLQIQIQTLRIELRAERERSKQIQLPNGNNSSSNNGLDINYYLQKIRSLQEALAAVGDEYNDSKQALNNARRNNTQPSPQQNNQMEDIQKLQGERQYLAYINLQLSQQIQLLRRRQTQLNAKQGIYIRQLESMSRELVSLKQIIGKPSEKNIITNLPQKSNPVNVNYQQFESDLRKKNYDGAVREMEMLIEGKTRWEGTRLLESLQRWRVPIIIMKEIEDLLTYVTQIVELLKFIREDYIHQNQLPKDLLLENLLEFVFRILVYFSDISANSNEAQHLRAQILSLSQRYSGGVFFTAIEQYTIHILENNAIEQYKRQLRAKAKELLEIKEKLDELITRQIEQQEKIVNRPHSHRERDTTPYRQSLNASPKPIK